MTLVFPQHGAFRRAFVFSMVLLLAPLLRAATTVASFSPQTRLGYRIGDQWEPSIAADEFGHVYVLYPQYRSLPACDDCALPAMTLLVSDNNGATWQPPHDITPHQSGQFDPQIVVDPGDHRTVFAAWLQNRNTEAVVAKSVDFGQSWSLTIADRDEEDADKPVLAVRGADVYLGFNRDGKMRIAASHDGGVSFTTVDVAPGMNLVRALGGGATVDPDRGVHLAWAGYPRNGANSGQVNLFISSSSDGGKTWQTTRMATSSAAPGCSAFQCEWGFLGAQITIASDAAGTLYTLWNSGKRDGAPQRIYFASSTTGGETWSAPADVSLAARGVEHAFPALVAGEADDVRIAWMDTRRGSLWNTFYRGSTNGGATWSTESRLSGFVPGYRYIRPKGYSFPFGDYFGIAIDGQGHTQAVWGEGLNYHSPGSIWYSANH